MALLDKEIFNHSFIAIDEMLEWHQQFTNIVAHGVYGYTHPPEMHNCHLLISAVKSKFINQLPPIDIQLSLAEKQIFKRALIRYRRKHAQIIEQNREKTIHPDLTSIYGKQLQALNDLLDLEWLQDTTPTVLPCEASYVPIEMLESHNPPPLPQREYDEKFHILQTPTLFLADLKYHRDKREKRGTGLIVAYIDIDEFGKFNQAYTETEVDRLVLPRFMRLLESYTYHHGHVYRYGGDEYAILIPNMSFELGGIFLDGLREEIAQTTYPEIDRKITVSMGFCYIDANSHFTDREVLKMANDAKAYAKANGRDCLATYKDSRFEKDSLITVGSLAKS